MDRVNKILEHPDFRIHLEKNKTAEADRRFCRHDMVHFLDVARIGMIFNLEEGLGIPREVIYGAALLHDIGKHMQYEENIPHQEASALIAPEILAACGYSAGEIEQIADAILQHRNAAVTEEKNLRGILYRADKASRSCFDCQVREECNWENKKKNMRIVR